MRALVQGMRRVGLGLAAVSLLVCAIRAQDTAPLSPTNATVKVSTISAKDPHPTTYNWDGQVATVTKPGNTYYYFYYTGTVQPDARVPDDASIGRVAVPLNDWAQNKRWIIAQLTLFYQQANNLPPTALQDYQAGPTAPNAIEPQAQPTPQPTPMIMQPQMNQPPPQGGGQNNNAGEMENIENDDPDMARSEPNTMGPGGPANRPGGFGPVAAFDPKVAAEWTFYYDQLVLWQYYCARTLLKGQDKNLLEQMPSLNPQQQGQQQLLSQVSGMTPQMLRRTTLQESRRLNQRGGQPGGQNDMSQFSSQYVQQGGPGGGGEMEMTDMGMGGGMGGGMGMGGMGMGGMMMGGQQVTMLRERFEPQKDYSAQTDGSKSKADEYRDKFIEAAKQRDDQIYTLYIDMIKGIDKRQANNEEYEKWIKDKRQEVSSYAETWRKLEHGETIMLGGTMFLVSKEPLESVPNQSINIIKRDRLTPADLLNPDGTVRVAK